jgi:hypothetical protein
VIKSEGDWRRAATLNRLMRRGYSHRKGGGILFRNPKNRGSTRAQFYSQPKALTVRFNCTVWLWKGDPGGKRNETVVICDTLLCSIVDLAPKESGGERNESDPTPRGQPPRAPTPTANPSLKELGVVWGPITTPEIMHHQHNSSCSPWCLCAQKEG